MLLAISKNTFFSGLCLGAAAIVSHSMPTQAQQFGSGDLTVEVTGLRNTNGQVCFSLFNKSSGFPDSPEAIIARQCIAAVELIEPSDIESITAGSITAGSITTDEENTPTENPRGITFEDLEAGTYAVSILHDENEDSEMSTGAFGIPTEGFGFSRNPKIQMSAPKFSEAAVIVVGSQTTTQIALIYF